MSKGSFRSSVSVALLGLGFLSAYAQGTGGRPTATQALLQSLEGRPEVPLVLVQTHYGPDGRPMAQMRIEVDGDGKVRRTVLSPSPRAGMTITDNLRDLIIVDRRSGRVEVRASPSRYRMPRDQRLALIERNYRLSLDGRSRVAGQPVIRVVAAPRAPGMETRRFSLDEKTFLLVRLERQAGSSWEPILDTLSIERVSRHPAGTFDIPKQEGLKVSVKSPPVIMGPNPPVQVVELGFPIRRPQALPYGFVVADTQLLRDDDHHMVALRLTDGLHFATVYQMPPRKADRPRRRGEGRPIVEDRHGVRYVLMGDLPAPVRQQILQVFVEEGNRP